MHLLHNICQPHCKKEANIKLYTIHFTLHNIHRVKHILIFILLFLFLPFLILNNFLLLHLFFLLFFFPFFFFFISFFVLFFLLLIIFLLLLSFLPFLLLFRCRLLLPHYGHSSSSHLISLYVFSYPFNFCGGLIFLLLLFSYTHFFH